jgi:hypothetical protein
MSMNDYLIMDKSEFVIELVKAILSSESSDDDVLACMAVLHIYCIKVADTVSIDDAGLVRILSPLTRKHCAETVAAALGKNSGPRSHPEYWYVQYDLKTPFEVAADIQGGWKGMIEKSKESITNTGLVSELIED